MKSSNEALARSALKFLHMFDADRSMFAVNSLDAVPQAIEQRFTIASSAIRNASVSGMASSSAAASSPSFSLTADVGSRPKSKNRSRIKLQTWTHQRSSSRWRAAVSSASSIPDVLASMQASRRLKSRLIALKFRSPKQHYYALTHNTPTAVKECAVECP